MILKNEIEKLTDEIHRLEESQNNNKDELLQLKQKLQQTEDDRYNLSKRKDDLEKDLSNLQFQTSEEKDRAKREIESLMKKN